MADKDQPSTQLPPQDLEAEQAAIGAMLVEPGAAVYAIGYVSHQDFYREAHQTIFRAMETLYAAKSPIDMITVSSELRRLNLLDQVGGAEYLDSLITTVPTAAHVARYAGIVAEKSRLRRLIRVAADIQEAAYDQEITVEEALGKLMDLGGGLDHPASATASEIATEMQDWLEEHIRAKPQPMPPFLGIEEADTALGGLENEELVILEALQKHGKTALLRQSALYTARFLKEQGRPEMVLIYLCEGGRVGWMLKAFAYLGLLHTSWLKRGSCYVPPGEEETPRAWRAQDMETAVFGALGQFAILPVIVNARLKTVEQIEADVVWQMAKGVQPIGIWVDYLQKVKTARRGSDTEQVRAAAQGLMEMHRRFGVPVITGSQVTKEGGGVVHAYMGKSVDQEGSLVLYLERGKPGAKDDAETLKGTDARLICKYSRYGAPFPSVALRADLDHAQFCPVGREGQQPELEVEGPDQRY